MENTTTDMISEDIELTQTTDSSSDSESSTPTHRAKSASISRHWWSVRSDDYLRRRARNNNAVRKSRDKSRQQQREQERRLVELTKENELLQKKAELLLKEIVVLKGLFPTFGIVPSPDSLMSSE